MHSVGTACAIAVAFAHVLLAYRPTRPCVSHTCCQYTGQHTCCQYTGQPTCYQRALQADVVLAAECVWLKELVGPFVVTVRYMVHSVMHSMVHSIGASHGAFHRCIPWCIP